MQRLVHSNLRADGDRLWRSIHAIAQIRPGKVGGCNRQAQTDENGVTRSLFRDWRFAVGLTVGVDQMGNMFATRLGTDLEALPVFVAPHLDTQPTGGRYDGVLSILVGLEVVRAMSDLDLRTCHPITIVTWSNKEGSASHRRCSHPASSRGSTLLRMPLAAAAPLVDRKSVV